MLEARRGRTQIVDWGALRMHWMRYLSMISSSKYQLESPTICTNGSVQAGPPHDSRINHPPAAASRIDLLLLVAINFMWGLKWTLSKVALRELEPISITLFPMIGAVLLLLPFLHRRLVGQRAYLGIIRPEALRPANLFRFFLLGLIGQSAAHVFNSWGLKYVPATDAAFISLGTPIANAILAVIIVHEALTWRLLPAFGLAVMGVLVMTGITIHGGAILNWYYLFGVLLFFASKTGSAFYNAYSKKLLGRFTPTEILFYSYVFVAVSLYPLHLLLERPVSIRQIAGLHWQTWCSLILLCLLVYGLSMVLFLEVLTRRALAPVAVSMYLMTVFGALISTTTLHEPVTGKMVVGALLVFLGAIFANSGKIKIAR
jgi:drug/metabolite transporter (DMT)-like permease